MAPVSKAPGSRPFVEGAITLRKVVPVSNTRKRFGMLDSRGAKLTIVDMRTPAV